MFGRGYGFDPYEFNDILFGHGSRHNIDGDVDRRFFAPVSDRALRAQNEAQAIFLKHLATVDTSRGPVSHEIINFHLVPDMKKAFHKFVKSYGCTATSRKLTREEQDRFNKTRKSLMQFTSVKVTPEAQKAYLAKNPNAVKATNTSTAAAGSSTASVPSVGKKRDSSQAELEANTVSKKVRK